MDGGKRAASIYKSSQRTAARRSATTIANVLKLVGACAAYTACPDAERCKQSLLEPSAWAHPHRCTSAPVAVVRRLPSAVRLCSQRHPPCVEA